MSRLFLCILLSIVFSRSFGQTKPVTLNGFLVVNTGETFPYKVVFTEVNGIVSGYSLTYQSPDETKTKIKGTLDRRNHTLLFKETEIVYSHNVHTKAYMCLVDAQLVSTTGSKGTALKGPITSMQADRTSCTGGSLIFTNQDEIQFLFAYHDQLDTVINMKKRIREQPSESKPPTPVTEVPLVTEKVTAGIEKTYDWHTDTVVVEVWDGGNTDGDRITIDMNGKAYLLSYTLVKDKKIIRIPLGAQTINTITILAENEGSDPPNTASMFLTDGNKKYSLLAYNNKGQRSIIKIKRIKP